MLRIYKYDLSFGSKQTLSLPLGYKILTIINQREKPVLYAVVDDSLDIPKENVNIVCRGTGHPAPGTLDMEYLGTAPLSDGSLVLHFFKEI